MQKVKLLYRSLQSVWFLPMLGSFSQWSDSCYLNEKEEQRENVWVELKASRTSRFLLGDEDTMAQRGWPLTQRAPWRRSGESVCADQQSLTPWGQRPPLAWSLLGFRTGQCLQCTQQMSPPHHRSSTWTSFQRHRTNERIFPCSQEPPEFKAGHKHLGNSPMRMCSGVNSTVRAVGLQVQ